MVGHECSVVDLNAHFLQPQVSKRGKHGTFVGDHDKPMGSQSSLGTIERDFMGQHILPGLPDSNGAVDLHRKVHFGFLSHDKVQTVALTHDAFLFWVLGERYCPGGVCWWRS